MSSLDEIFETHHRKVYQVAFRLLRNREEAEDIVQEVFVQVWKSLASFKNQSQLSTWIYRITINKCLDTLRVRKRRSFLSPFFFLKVDEEVNQPNLWDDNPDALDRLERKEQLLALHNALEKLPVMQQTAFVLLRMEEMTQKEAALYLGISEKALESLLQRANKGLRKYLEKFYNKRRN